MKIKVKNNIICRVCSSISTYLYSTAKLPECIWPTKKKTKFSKCHVYSCTNCFHLQLQNFSKKKISKFYGENQCNTDSSSLNKKRLLLIKKKYGKNYFKNKKILDVGGGVNPVLKNNNVFLADMIIQKTNKNIFKKRYFEIDIEEKKIDEKFDIIFLIHTLEHFKFPLKAIGNIKSSLKNNGRLFIEIPNFDYMLRKMTYYSIFHQHLSMFSLKHLKNFFILSNLKIEKLFNINGVIFCSVKKTNLKKKKIITINNKKIFKILKKKIDLTKKKILNHIKKNKFNIYGAGGSMSLAIASIVKSKNKINKIFDNDPAKFNYNFPGTKNKILASNKVLESKDIISISNYELKKKNNLNIQNL